MFFFENLKLCFIIKILFIKLKMKPKLKDKREFYKTLSRTGQSLILSVEKIKDLAS